VRVEIVSFTESGNGHGMDIVHDSLDRYPGSYVSQCEKFCFRFLAKMKTEILWINLDNPCAHAKVEVDMHQAFALCGNLGAVETKSPQAKSRVRMKFVRPISSR
jgi:hypothetical protein